MIVFRIRSFELLYIREAHKCWPLVFCMRNYRKEQTLTYTHAVELTHIPFIYSGMEFFFETSKHAVYRDLSLSIRSKFLCLIA